MSEDLNLEKPIDVPPDEPVISVELQAKVQAIRGFAEAHNILAIGQFDCRHFQTVASALLFLKTLHETAISEACMDKGAWRVPELKEHLDKLKEKAKAPEVPVDGKA